MGNDRMASLEGILRSCYSEPQLRAIKSDAGITAVKAGAGTGKTHTLSGRVAYLLAVEPELSLDQMAVLTFTEKAAQEMRDRIEAILRSWGEELKDPRLLDMSNRIGEAYISTIHSFALRMILESSMDMPVPLNASVLGDCAAHAFRRELAMGFDQLDHQWFLRHLDDKWKGRAESLLGDPMIQELINRIGPHQMAETVMQAANILGGTEGFSPSALWDLAEREDLLQSLLDRLLSSRGEWLMKASNLARRLLEQLGCAEPCFAEGNEQFEMIGLIREFVERSKGLRGAKRDEMTNTLLSSGDLGWLLGDKEISPSEVRNAMNEGINSMLNLLSLMKEDSPPEVQVLGMLNRLCALGWEVWNRRRFHWGQLSFQDLIDLAGQAVRTEPLRSRFKHVLIDEFQDTDWLQFSLVSSFMEGGAKIFAVGDLKQSIYRFRNADLTLFGRLIALAKSGQGLTVSLTESRRSSKVVIGTINRVFSHTFRQRIGQGLDEAYEPLKHPDGDDHTPRKVLIIPQEGPDDWKVSAEEAIRSASLRLGAEFLQMYRRGEEVRSQEGTRRCRWEDFAILVPARTQYPRVSSALQELGIPHVLCSSTDYWGRFETWDVAALMAAIGGDQSELGALKVAASPFAGCFLTSAGGRIMTNPIREGDLPTLIEYGRRASEVMRGVAQAAGPAAVVDHILRDLSWLGHVAPWERERVVLNLRRARDLLWDYQRHMGNSLMGAAEYLRSSIGRSMEEPEIPPEEAVKVMTIHAAKGLEFPITGVILSPPTGNGGDTSRVTVSKHLGLVPSDSLVKDLHGTDGVLSGIHKDLEETALEEEGLRLFYVACTRARDRLILAVPKGNRKNRWARETMEALMPLGEGVLVDDPQGEDPQQAESAARPEGSSSAKAISIPKRSGAMLQMSATAYSLFQFCPRAYRITFRQGLNPKWGGDFAHNGPGGTDLGSLAHWVMRRWSGDGDEVDEILQDQASMPEEVRMALISSGQDAGELARWLRGFAASECGQEFRELLQRGAKREAPFRVPIGDRFRMLGSMDLLLLDPKGPIIRDYKITHHENPIQELYRHQMLFYGLAANLITGKEPHMALWRLRPVDGKYQVIEVEGVRWDQMAEQMLDVAARAASGPYEPRRDRCHHCMWRESCGG